MAFAQGSRSGLSYIKETTFGTTPAGNLTALPITNYSLDLSKERVQGNDIQPDRMTRVDRHGNRNAVGDIVADLRKGDYDDLLESAFFNDFSTDTLKVGVDPKFLTLQDTAFNISETRTFTGMAVSSVNFSIAPNQMVVTTFSMVGKDMTQGSSGGTVDDASDNAPFDSYSGTIGIGDTGGSLTNSGCITSIDLTLDNSLAPTFCVGEDTTPQLEFGRAVVEGTVTFYYEDASIINRFLNETETALQFSVDDPTGTNPYTILLPKVKFNGAAVPVSDPQSRVITVPIVALYDSVEESNIVLTRTS